MAGPHEVNNSRRKPSAWDPIAPWSRKDWAEQKTACRKGCLGSGGEKGGNEPAVFALAAEAANCILSCGSKVGASRARDVTIPLHHEKVHPAGFSPRFQGQQSPFQVAWST